MILNAPLLLETAILMLAAFLAGAVIGLLSRLLLARPKPAVATQPAEVKPAETTAPQLVTAPAIAPLPVGRPNAAQRLAAAAGAESASPMPAIKMPEMTLPGMPAIASMEPSHVAGETVAGRHIDNPEHPQPASLEDVRAELVAQIDASPEPIAAVVEGDTPVAPASDAEIVPAAVAEPDPELPSADAALAAEAATPMLAEVPTEAIEDALPVEQRVEPEIEAAPVELTDAPEEVAAEVQDVVEVATDAPVPEVVAEAPLVEPVYEKEAEDAALPSPAEPEPAHDEMAAMRAIEGGWSPRRPATSRKPADLPEGVSVAEAAAADRAVANSGEAVANATALASAVLEEIAPPRPVRPAGGFGRPASLQAPRDGGKDDFGLIKGIGPAVESSLNGLGIYHFDQIADWDQKAVVWIENHFGFKGRITRERWQEQARDLTRRKAPVSRPVRR